MRDLLRLPKAHLHLHLIGAARLSTYRELAAAAGLPAPEPGTYANFAEFQTMISAAARAFAAPEALRRVVYEAVEDAAREGAVWIEGSCQLVQPQGTVDPGLELVVEAGQAAAAEFGIGFGLVVAGNRVQGPDAVQTAARVAAAMAGDGVVGFGLDGDEDTYPAEAFADAFAIAAAAGLPAVPHAGELLGPGSVRAALDHLGARRVMHGVRAVEDDDLLALLADSQVALDVCPTSNVALSVAPSLAEHPLPTLLAAGVRCTVNADDPLPFRTGLLAEYQLCRDVLRLSDEQLAGIARTSVEFSGAPDDIQRSALAGIDAWISG